MKAFYCLLLLLCAYMSRAQQAGKLEIGETLPAVNLRHVLNYSSSSIKPRDFTPKLVILNFIRTTCSGCLEKLPAYEALQQQHKESLQIILVTREKTAQVQAFMKRRPGAFSSFPIVAADETLAAFFPHESLSHLVWIGKDGSVKAITEGDYVTAGNIQLVLSGQDVNWPVKKDIPFFDYKQPLVKLGEHVASLSNMQAITSVLLPYLPNVAPHFASQNDSSNGVTRTVFFNHSIIDVYCFLQQRYHFPLSQVWLSAADRSRFFYLEKMGQRRAWYEKNSFCYESVLPLHVPAKERLNRMWRDLDFYFAVSAAFVKKTVPCFVLTRADNLLPWVAQPSTGITAWTLVQQLNNRFSQMPVLLEDRSLQRVTIDIAIGELEDTNLLTQKLKEAGLLLRPATRELELLIINEQQHSFNQN